MKTGAVGLVLSLVILVLLSSLPSQAQQVRFAKTIGGDLPDEGFGVIQDRDGGYVVVGYTQSYGTGGSSVGMGNHDVMVSKFDSSGNILWARTVGTYDVFDFGGAIVQVSDGGYVVAGQTQSPADMLVFKLDNNANLLWTKTLGGSDADVGQAVIEVPGGTLVAGSTASYGAGGYDLLLSKFDPDGNHLWTKTLGGPQDDFNMYYGPGLILASDGNIVVAGWTSSFGAGAGDAMMCKFDADGNLLWARALGAAGNEAVLSVTETMEGGFLFAGWTDSFDGVTQILLSLFDADGNHLWTKTIGGAAGGMTARKVVRIPNGGYTIGGTFNGVAGSDCSTNVRDILLTGIDGWGNLLWATNVAFGVVSTCDMTKGFALAADGGYIITGETVNPYQPDVPLVKFDTMGGNCLGAPVSLTVTDRTAAMTVTKPALASVTQSPTVNVATPTVTSPTVPVTTICQDTVTCTADVDCDDGDVCDGKETCQGGSCRPGTPLACSGDGNPCTDDSCDPITGCVYTNNTAPCDDGDPCTGPDQCNGAGVCAPGPNTCVDGGTDGGADAGGDPGTDGGIDAGADTGTDGGVDAGADPGTDGSADAGMDGATDAGSDSGTGDPGTGGDRTSLSASCGCGGRSGSDGAVPVLLILLTLALLSIKRQKTYR